MQSRIVLRRLKGLPASDGAGVKLTRVIAQPALPELDPFLLLDEFGTDRPEDYIAGFPPHPHRGFETVTYMLEGRMRHRDNHGREGVIGPGDAQWMTAGRGVIHSEMPEQSEGRMRGFQLWLNLPAKDKMQEPAYQEISAADIPVWQPFNGARVAVLAGNVAGFQGPVQQPATDPYYLDVSLPPHSQLSFALPDTHAAAAYVFEGAVGIGGEIERIVGAQELGVLGGGDGVSLRTADQPGRLLLLAGKPLGEPIARHGPFVMNTREELIQAFVDFQQNKF